MNASHSTPAIPRRTVLGGMLTTALASGLPQPAASAEADRFREPARDLPIRTDAQVIVCGAGPAGVAAAVASARKGVRTLLIEAHGCLGGIWTAGLLSWILDYQNKSGVMAEILARLEKRNGRSSDPHGGRNGYDPEVMKLVLEELCAEAGVRVLLHARVCAAYGNPERRLTHVVTESKSGREAVAGQVFIDCTGDGDVGAQAGVRFDVGHPQTGQTQPMSLMALLAGLVPEQVLPFYERGGAGASWAGPKDRLRVEMERGGHSPSYAKPTLFHLRDDLFAMMANHEYKVLGTDARQVTEATLRARREVHALVDGLRSLGGPWKNVRVVATAEQIGVREGRRLRGRYVVCADDLREGRTHPDAVCKVTFPIDVHSTDPGKEKGIAKADFRAKPYDIPLRALVAEGVTGLLMAGRCISGDFIAHSSYRVTGNAVAMGQAAGSAAALAVQSGRLP